MTIKNGNVADADEVMNAFGSNFNDTAQNIFNADYLGFDSRLANSGVPIYKNLFYSTFTSDDANETQNIGYDVTNDLYKTPEYFVVIEASSFGAWSNGTNDTFVEQEASGRWIVYCDTGTAEVKRAQVMKSLFFGTSGSNQLILDFTSITSIKSSDSRDVGKRGHYATASRTTATAGTWTYTGTFADTSTNTDCSSWSSVTAEVDSTARWEIPEGTTANSVGDGTSDELGTDTSADEVDNPTDCQISLTNALTRDVSGRAVVLCSGGITWVDVGLDSFSNIDFFTDHSIPDFTDLTNKLTSFLIFKDTVPSTDNAVAVINSQIDATSSEQISISADGGSNFTDVDNTEIARPVAGTELWRKIVITRTDLSKEDKVTEQAVKHNFY